MFVLVVAMTAPSSETPDQLSVTGGAGFKEGGMSSEKKQFTAEELNRIDEADDLKISPFRDDGVTYGTPTWIWSVAVDGDLYVRAYHGQDSSWYKAALRQKAWRFTAAGLRKEVTFEPVEDEAINDLIDDAYRAKYHDSPYLAPMIDTGARSATVKIMPRDEDSRQPV